MKTISSQTKLKILSALIIIGVALFTFKDITQIFFQQDEWLGLGGAITRSEEGGLYKVFQDTFLHGESPRILPTTALANYVIFNTFKTNTSYYGILSLVLVIISAILLNFTFQKLTKSFLIALIASLLWFTNNLSLQAVTFIGAIITSQFSFLFFAIGFYFFVSFLESSGKIVLFWLSILAITISLGFKESSAFYIIVFPFIIWFFPFFKQNFGSKFKITTLLLIPLLATLLLPRILLPKGDFSPDPILASILATKEEMIYNVFLLPAKSLFHIFLSNSQIYEIVYSVNRIFFQTQIDGFVLGRIVGDAFSLLVAFYILLLILFALALSSKDNKKLILFGLLSFFASFEPFIVFKSTDVALQPRYYVFPAVFSSFLLAVTVHSFTSKFKVLGPALTALVFFPVIIFYISGVQKILAIDIQTGDYRRSILNTVSEVKPSLAKDNVFYFFTAHTGFWEFQSGFGQTLAVWLYDTGKIPKEALTDRDFWDPSYEGIKQYNSRGKYGYFMTYEKLSDALKENPDIALEEIHAYYWDYQKHTVKNVSEEIRERLKNDTSNKKTLQ